MSDALLKYIKESVDRIEDKLDKHDERIGHLENWQHNANGKVTMLGAIGVAIGGFITWLTGIFHH